MDEDLDNPACLLAPWLDEQARACLASGLEDEFEFELTPKEEELLNSSALTIKKLLALVETKTGNKEAKT